MTLKRFYALDKLRLHDVAVVIWRATIYGPSPPSTVSSLMTFGLSEMNLNSVTSPHCVSSILSLKLDSVSQSKIMSKTRRECGADRKWENFD